MSNQLVPYEALTAVQRQQLEELEIHPEQIKFSGDIHGALHTLLGQSTSSIRGFVMLHNALPVAFFMLKRPPYLPPWAAPDSATLHALQVDRRLQGRGIGRACLEALPAIARQAWPNITELMLSVDADNESALKLYLKLGWVDTGEAYKGRIGYERRLAVGLLR